MAVSCLRLCHQVLELDAWLRPPPLHATHWNELPGPGHAPDHAHQHTLLWEAPDIFLGNKVRNEIDVS